MKKSKTVIAALILALVIAVHTTAIAQPSDNLPQRIENGIVYIPLRLTAYSHGAAVEWNADTRTVYITDAGGSRQSVAVEAAGGFIEDGVSWIPYEYAARLFGTPVVQDHAEATDAEQLIASIIDVIDGIEAARLFAEEHSKVLDITSTDGYVFQGRLTMPAGDEKIPAIVIDTGTSGPHTYLMGIYVPGIGRFNYWDFWAKEYANNGVAFFTANTRGVTPSDEPPAFMDIDEEGYLTYLPSNVVEDVYHMIRAVRENPRLADAKIFLNGHSEGAIIASLFEATHPGIADVLLLAGIPVTGMADIVRWQASGGATMMVLAEFFEVDEYGRISREAFYAGPWETMMGASFEELDLDRDGFFDVRDLLAVWELMGVPPHMYDADVVFDAVARGDDEWLRENYPVLLTAGWFQEHFDLRSNMEMLTELDLPIYIFHGTLDANVYVGHVRELEDRLREMGRTNVVINIFLGHGHDLNFGLEVFLGEISDGIQAIFDAVIARII